MFQETLTYNHALISYHEARGRIREKHRSRGFWPVQGGSKSEKGLVWDSEERDSERVEVKKNSWIVYQGIKDTLQTMWRRRALEGRMPSSKSGTSSSQQFVEQCFDNPEDMSMTGK